MLRVKQNPRTREVLDNYERYCGRCYVNFEDEFAHQIHRTHGGKSYSQCLDPESVDLEPYINVSGSMVWKCKD